MPIRKSQPIDLFCFVVNERFNIKQLFACIAARVCVGWEAARGRVSMEISLLRELPWLPHPIFSTLERLSRIVPYSD